TVGPDGAIWFTVQTSSTIESIGRISTAGVMTLYPVETTPANSLPAGITKGPDGAMWFVEYNANMVGRLQ
ncbi:MAG: Virginiamycin B lyase, partial [Candidatus Eremiobacteraeota bacterium]|nr:Virginiamycin B lyase [Candidatus Eremiobacteraeota bacterium]